MCTCGMYTLSIRMFGRLGVSNGDQTVHSLGPAKVDELFCYLLIHRDRPCLREALASILWQNCTTAQSKAYLRRALWQLQTALKELFGLSQDIVDVSGDWIRCDPGETLWLDVARFDQACRESRDRPGEALSDTEAEALDATAALYVGDFLEGSYYEWCLLSREHYRHQYVTLLDKLVEHHSHAGRYEQAIASAEVGLRFDPARERSHRQLMRLYWMAGDRAAALRQYRLCGETLRTELDVAPSRSTEELHERIRGGISRVSPAEPLPRSAPIDGEGEAEGLLARLQDTVTLVRAVEDRLCREISALEARRQVPPHGAGAEGSTPAAT